jgi:hypothetical protein
MALLYFTKVSSCSSIAKVVHGVSVVLLVWTDGQIRIPIGFQVWEKGGPSKFELALNCLAMPAIN